MKTLPTQLQVVQAAPLGRGSLGNAGFLVAPCGDRERAARVFACEFWASSDLIRGWRSRGVRSGGDAWGREWSRTTEICSPMHARWGILF